MRLITSGNACSFATGRPGFNAPQSLVRQFQSRCANPGRFIRHVQSISRIKPESAGSLCCPDRREQFDLRRLWRHAIQASSECRCLNDQRLG